MRRQSVAWERAAEVREAAEGWLRAGAIGTATYDAVLNAYPDPCVTPSAVWRILTAGMVTAVVVCTLGALYVATQPGAASLALLLFVLAAAAFMVTEYLEASPRSARRGAAGATAFWGNIFVLGGLGIFLSEAQHVDGESALDAVLLASALVWAASCWRWGTPLFAGLSAVSSFLFLSRLPLGRALWLLAGAALVGLVARRPDDLAWAPSHRRAAMVLLVVGVAAVYGASNVYSLDQHVVEGFLKFAPPPRRAAVLAHGGRGHRHGRAAPGHSVVGPEIATDRAARHGDRAPGAVARHAATLRARRAPLGGADRLGCAAHRPVRSRSSGPCAASPGGERWGFTADPLFSDERRQQILQTVPVVAAFTPPAAPVAATDAPGFTGRGGAFGGGGASDKF